MRKLIQFFIRSLLSLTAVCATIQAAPTDELGVNPCPGGFTYSHHNEIHQWHVCIESSLYSDNDADEPQDFEDECPMVESGDILQAWNPEAGVCFQIQTEVLAQENDVFSVTRDAASRQIRVALHDDLVDAGCDGPVGAYLVSPNNVYCILDVGLVEAYTFVEIEAMGDAYFQRLYECLAHLGELQGKRLQLLQAAYLRYVEFAYYSNPNVRIEWELPARNAKNSRQQHTADTGKDFGYTTESRCKIPNVSKIIGLINH